MTATAHAAGVALIAIVIMFAIFIGYSLLTRNVPQHAAQAGHAPRRARAGAPHPAGPAPVAAITEIHHEPRRFPGELSPFPVPGYLDMLPDDPPPADTVSLPVVQCELGGLTTDEYLDALFARHAAESRAA